MQKWFSFVFCKCFVLTFSVVNAQDSESTIFTDSQVVVMDTAAIKLNLLRYSLFEEVETEVPSKTKSGLILPEHELGKFCIFEKNLRRKTKLPLDFGTD